MSLKRYARSTVRQLAKLRALLPAAQGARIFTYHSVRPSRPGPASSYVTPEAFTAQMSWLARSGYEVVSLSQLADRVSSRQAIPPDWVCLTFDDGYVDNYLFAYPILKQFGFPATIFLVSGKTCVDPNYLTYAQIQDMLQNSISFGAHTVDHVSLSSVAADEAKRQIEASKAQVEAITAQEAAHFCYPYGHYDAVVADFVREAGFRTCCTEFAGPVLSTANLLALHRVGVLGTDTVSDFSLRARGAYDWWINSYMVVEEQRRRMRGG